MKLTKRIDLDVTPMDVIGACGVLAIVGAVMVLLIRGRS